MVSVPKPLLEWLDRHREQQEADRRAAGTLWHDGEWMFTQPTGKPVDPRADYQEWRDLLSAADVRPARSHGARHTAATMLLILKVPVRAVMGVMGRSEASMASRSTHVPDELKHEIADQVAGLLWSSPSQQASSPADEAPVELTEGQRSAIRLIASALPPYEQRRFTALLDGEYGNDGTPVLA